MSEYRPADYWSALLAEEYSLRGVTYPDLPLSFTRHIYSAAQTAVERALAGVALDLDAVLDVGSGTGVWVELWKRRGARRLVGLDLTTTAVERLRRRYPEYEFHQADLSQPGLPVEGSFGVVSAMNVLLHVVDDDGWRRALANLASRLAPDGVLVVMDAVVFHRWWGPAIDERAIAKPRPIEEWRRALAEHGLEIVRSVPTTCLLANPVDTRRRRSFQALWWYWIALTRALRGRERLGEALGRPLHALDRRLVRRVRPGPSAKCLVIRRA